MVLLQSFMCDLAWALQVTPGTCQGCVSRQAESMLPVDLVMLGGHWELPNSMHCAMAGQLCRTHRILAGSCGITKYAGVPHCLSAHKLSYVVYAGVSLRI